METTQLTEGTKVISGGLTQASGWISSFASYFTTLSLPEYILLFLIAGVVIYLWIVIKREKKHQNILVRF